MNRQETIDDLIGVGVLVAVVIIGLLLGISYEG